MLIGHYALGLSISSRSDYHNWLPFFFILLGSQLTDILWPIFTLIGLEGGMSLGNLQYHAPDIPWSHSLLTVIGWTLGYSLLVYFVFQWQKHDNTKQISFLAGLAVFTHWLLDVPMLASIELVPFMSSSLASLDLYNDIFIAFSFELVVILIFWLVYHRTVFYQQTNKLKGSSLLILGLLIFLHLFFYIPSFLDLAAIDLDANRLAAAGILAIELGGVVGLTYLHNKFARS